MNSYDYQLPKLLITISETDAVNNRLTDQQLYKVSASLFNWPGKEFKN